MTSSTKYDRWQERLRQAGKRLDQARDVLRTEKTTEGRREASRLLAILLEQAAGVANEIEDADDSCYYTPNTPRIR